MPRLFWLCDATQAPSKNLKDKSQEKQPHDENLKIITYAKTINTIPSAEELSKTDEPPSWLTRLRKAADLQRKSRQSFYIDPPVINSHQRYTPPSNSHLNTTTLDMKPNVFELESPTYEDPKTTIPKAKSKPRSPTTEPLYDPSLAEEYNKAILAYISSGTVPKAKSKSTSKTQTKSSSKSSNSPQAQAPTSKSTLQSAEENKQEPPKKEAKLNMANSRIIFQSPQVTVILTPPEGEFLGVWDRSPTQYKSLRCRPPMDEFRNPFHSIRNSRLGLVGREDLYLAELPGFSRRSSDGSYTLTPNTYIGDPQTDTFSPTYQPAIPPSSSPHHLKHTPTHYPSLRSNPQYDTTHLTPHHTPTRKETQLHELRDLRTFMIRILIRDAHQLDPSIRTKIMEIYRIAEDDLLPVSRSARTRYLGGNGKEGYNAWFERRDVGRRKKVVVDEGVEFGFKTRFTDSFESRKGELEGLEMVLRGERRERRERRVVGGF